MNDRAILEFAEQHLNRYGRWTFTGEGLIAFARAIIKEERDAHGITVPIAVWDKLKDVNTVSDLIKALHAAEEE